MAIAAFCIFNLYIVHVGRLDYFIGKLVLIFFDKMKADFGSIEILPLFQVDSLFRFYHLI